MHSIEHQLSFWKLLGLLLCQLDDECLRSIFFLRLLLFLLFLFFLFHHFLHWWWGLLFFERPTTGDIDMDYIGAKAFNLVWIVQVNNILALISILLSRYLAYLIIQCVIPLARSIHYKVLVTFVGYWHHVSVYQLVGRVIIRLLITPPSRWVLSRVACLPREILLIRVLSTIMTPSLVWVTPHIAFATTISIRCGNTLFRHAIPDRVHFP